MLGKIGCPVLGSNYIVLKTKDMFQFGKKLNNVEKLNDILEGKTNFFYKKIELVKVE